MKLVGKAVLLFLIFVVMFFSTTALLDWVCWHTGYYDEAAKTAVVMD